jgi:hypothetical protein
VVTPIANREPDAGLIATLEDLLAQANRGELVAIAIATEHTGRSIGTAFCGDIDLYRMLGAIESLKRRMMEERDA